MDRSDSKCRAANTVENHLSADTLNRSCLCPGFDHDQFQIQMRAEWQCLGLSQDAEPSHPHWLASQPLYVAPKDIAMMIRLAQAIESVVCTDVFRQAIHPWSADLESSDGQSPGGVLGFDFHLSGTAPPQLIEINTNPGGILLGLPAARAVKACTPDQMQPATKLEFVEQRLVDIMRQEWHRQMGDRPLQTIAIVDDHPKEQYLYPELLLYRQLFEQHGIKAEIASPEQLALKNGRVILGNQPVGMIYNRLTDFYLEQPANALIKTAFGAGQVALSPHPSAYARYADKRNLTVLSSPDFYSNSGISEQVAETLLSSVPVTVMLTADNREALWSERRHWFFKPATGYGSKASYRGDKLTRRVWKEMQSTAYVAQALVKPGVRQTQTAVPHKFDVRCFAYRGEPLLFLGRLYQGQTTNFRTPGGGLAPVLTFSEAD